MEIKRKKIFGIGAVVLMMLVTLVPIVNSTQLNNANAMNDDSCDLKIEILEHPQLKNRAIVTDENGAACTTWIIEYRVTNNYNKRYASSNSQIRLVSTDETEKIIYFWYEELDIAAQDYVKTTKEIYAEVSEDSLYDEEQYLADNLVKLEIIPGGLNEIHPEDNFDIKRANKFWNSDSLNGPTLTQIKACFPWRYEEKTINKNGVEIAYPEITKLFEKDNRLAGFNCKGKTIQEVFNSNEYKNLKNWVATQAWDGWEEFWGLLKQFVEKFENVMDLFWEDLPAEIDNHRFGWFKNITRYVISIFVDITLFLLAGGSCVYTVINSQELAVITNWIRNACDLFGAMMKGDVAESLMENVFGVTILGQLISYTNTLLDLILICGGIELFLFAKAKYDFEQLREWKSKEPETWDIGVKGRVDYVRDGETITVKCGTTEKKYTEPKDGNDGSVTFSFKIPAKYPFKLPQKCVIEVTGSHESHEGVKLSTLPIASYCFSGGEVYKWFQDSRWRKTKDASQTKEMKTLQNIFKLIKTNLPIFFDNIKSMELLT